MSEGGESKVEKIRAAIAGDLAGGRTEKRELENPLERKRSQQAAYRERKRAGAVKKRKGKGK